MPAEKQTEAENLTLMHWAGGLGFGMLAGVAFVMVALLVESEIVKAGARRLFSRNPGNRLGVLPQ